MIVKIGGAVLQDKPLIDKYNEELDKLNSMVAKKSREVRRSKPIKRMLTFLGFIAPLGLASTAHAQTLGVDGVEQGAGVLGILAEKMLLRNSDGDSFIKDYVGLGLKREDSVVWHMNDWLQHALLHTTDFFDNAQVLSIFHAIWTICMSFVMLIISKKGFDMVKSRVLGTSSIGASQLIIRLLASVVMTFLSLDIMELGIKGSNLVIKTLFKAIESYLIPYEVLERTNMLGLVFWFIGFCFMTVILAIQYWVRQITIVTLGVLTPVANTSWVVDGGGMLKTLIREFITLISTPIVHGIILVVGSVCMHEVTTMTGNVWIDGFNSVMIGLSSMFLMVATPTFLRKFTTGTVNPFATAWNLGKGTYGNAMKLASLIKK